MGTITHTPQLESIYKSLSGLNVADLDRVMDQVISLRRQKLPSVLPEKETELLRKINKRAPSVIQKRYDALRQKLVSEVLTETEYPELLELTAYMESLQVERVGYMLELAKLRNITLDQLIEQLQLKPKTDVV